MPVISIKELSSLCNKKECIIHTYVKRGQIVKRPDGLFDTSNQKNRIYIDKHGKKDESKSVPKTEYTPDPTPLKITTSKKKTKEPNEDGKFVTAYEMEQLKAEKLEQEIIQLSLKNKRLEGDLIEFETVKQTTYEVINSYRTTNYLAAENVLKNNMKDLNCSNEQLTKAITDLQVLFNAACAEAIENVKLTLDKIL